jgi:signal transduction histidine kinase
VPEAVLDELKRYVSFGVADEAALRSLHAAAAPQLEQVADRFYERILAHAEARRALEGGERQVGHLRITLVAWMDRLLAGPWDEAYWESRFRIGRVHVRIGLPQHYMFGAMNLVRTELARIASEAFAAEPDRLHDARTALGKILDLELAIMLNSYRDDLLAQQARTERLSTFGQLVGSIAHDIRNPLGVIESSTHLLRQRAGEDAGVRKHVERISEQVAVANGIISNLLDMIRDRPLAREPVKLIEVVESAAASLARPPDVRLALEGLEGLPQIAGDAGQLRQVFVNLIQNAIHAASPRGEVLVRGSRGEGRVSLEVADSGPGVDPATRRRLFEPLITTKPNGVGLGLALVRRIAERHGGSVEYADRPGGGALFAVHLPAAPA